MSECAVCDGTYYRGQWKRCPGCGVERWDDRVMREAVVMRGSVAPLGRREYGYRVAWRGSWTVGPSVETAKRELIRRIEAEAVMDGLWALLKWAHRYCWGCDVPDPGDGTAVMCEPGCRRVAKLREERIAEARANPQPWACPGCGSHALKQCHDRAGYTCVDCGDEIGYAARRFIEDPGHFEPGARLCRVEAETPWWTVGGTR